MTEPEVAASWSALRAALPASARSDADTSEPAADGRIAQDQGAAVPPHWAYALAATLAVVSLGLGLWAANLRERVNAAEAPRANAPVVDVSTRYTVRGPDRVESHDDAATITIPRSAASFTLAVATEARVPSTVEARLCLRGAGPCLWRDLSLEKMERVFTIGLSRRRTPAGRYELVLSDPASATESDVATFAFDLVYAEEP